ncbi:cobaltochelatase subunit CobN [Cyclobacterium sp. 1_MG-2023]|uniref:cobaltochelatase subunit CobN n=1 Tax=Cyclobacterium sp. 1_MG-2023 TaxID=3062681 RepID=UPI0026E32461|nr:cobaltochelatase subunit CobN [Cyclobacterium sp. 1_MG-2023]MDO6435999.1 cobaltochelatase subunit CobN [Cyclobacterium sp. 1_MG-2023]
MKRLKKPLLKKIVLGLVIVILYFIGSSLYNKHVSTTKIAFINYQEFQLSRISRSNKSNWIQIDVLEMNELDKVRDYAAVFVFGRGFQMSPDQMEQLQSAGYAGVNLFVESATNPNVDVTNLKGEVLDKVTDYFKYGGTANYTNLLSYVRQEMDKKSWFVNAPEDPKPIPRDVFIHLEEDAVFEDFNTYNNYLTENGQIKAGQPKVALLTSVPGPFNSNREHIDDLIRMMKARNLNVYTISAATKRLEFLKEVNPDLVILMPHGRLTLGQENEAISWLKDKNIPLLTPLSVFQPYEEWVDDPQGFEGALLSMSVVLPELDGGINPYAIIAQYEDEMGYLSFQTIPDRLQKFGDMVEKWLALKAKSNKDKKIAIYYFKGPGLNAMVAANMEVVPSIYNALVKLKEEGYTVENLPDSPDELWEMINTQGSVLGPYAKGAFDDFLEKGNPAMIETSKYEQWVAKDLEEERYQQVIEKYGKAPGEYLSSRKGGKDYIAVARLQFGNIVLLPQPLAGLGEDTFRIIHGTESAPPHPYIASYLWTRNEFQADAIIHWGTHGSLEFTPGKQVALSGYDWTDALIGVSPHFYVYTISNVGEGIIAKRRSYAITLSYLTPPFMESEVSGDLKQLGDKLNAFVAAKGAVREQYRSSISDLAIDLDLHKDLGLDSTSKLDDETIFNLSNHIEEVRNAKVTGGLYTIGNSYSDEQLENTTMLMALDPIAYSLSFLDKLDGKVTQNQLDNQLYFDQNYRKRAKATIGKLKNGQDVEQVLKSLINPKDLAAAKAWKKRTLGMSDADIVKGFISMGDDDSGKENSKRKGKSETKGPSANEIEELKRLVIAISPHPDRVEFIMNLTSDKQFKQSSGILDPKTLEKAKTVAKAIPAMAKALEVGQQKDVFALLKMMQKEPLRQMTFELLQDEGLAEQVALEKERADKALIEKLTKGGSINSLGLTNNSIDLKRLPRKELLTHLTQLKTYKINWALVKETKPEPLATYFSQADFENKLGETINKIELKILALDRQEEEFARAVLNIEQAVRSVAKYHRDLESSTSAELQAVLTGLDGGYIAPSPGGDPITNPATVPTGRNLFSIDAEKTPSPEAWNVGVTLAETLLATHLEKHGKYPQKVSFTLWSGDFIGTEGAMVAEIFYLLGVEPVRDPFKRVVDIRLIPMKELGRPRVDVIVQTSGQFRDLAASRMFMINKAVKMAAGAEDSAENFVKAGVLAAEEVMKEKGMSPKQAREWSTQRVFGGVNGNYGTNIMGMVENGNGWDDEQEVADTYLNNMGAIYDEGENWGEFQKGVFEAALQNTEVVVQPRENNTWGGLSLDHVYEFMGGLSMAVRSVTGNDPDAYFNDFRNPSKASIQGLKEAIWVEARSTLLNPKYISEYMKGGASSAETFAETFRNTYGWNVMKPADVADALWNNLHDVYVNDKLNLNVKGFFERENPYALQDMTAVMLETIRKGYWNASENQIKELSSLHTELISSHKAGCSGFVCNNEALQAFITENLSEEAAATYEAALNSVKESRNIEDGMVLEKETLTEGVEDETFEENRNLVVYGLVGLLLLVFVFLIIKRRKQE